MPGFALDDLLPADTTRYFRYQGGLTTPPCFEGLKVLFKDYTELFKNQILQFEGLICSRSKSIMYLTMIYNNNRKAEFDFSCDMDRAGRACCDIRGTSKFCRVLNHA